MLKNTSDDDLGFFTFEAPVTLPESKSLRGTGPRGLVRDDRKVADADNARILRGPRRKG